MSQSDLGHSSISSAMGPPPTFDGARQRTNSGLGAGGVLAQANPLSLVQPDASSGLQANALNNNGNANQCKLLPKGEQVTLCIVSPPVRFPRLCAYHCSPIYQPLLKRHLQDALDG